MVFAECLIKKSSLEQRNIWVEFLKSHGVRHELIHAVAQECGVAYGNNEDLVDWIAHIIPIVNKAFDEIKEDN